MSERGHCLRSLATSSREARDALRWAQPPTVALSAAGDRSSLSADGTQTTYTYDGAHQLTQEQSGASVIQYSYDANHNRTQMTTSAGTTTYTYDTATDTELVKQVDPAGNETDYTYDASGNLTRQVYDPSTVNQTTTYTYDGANRLTGVSEPNGTTIAYTYTATGQRATATVTPSGGSATAVDNYYTNGQLIYQTDGNRNLLATYTYDSNGTPVSVAVGADPTTAPRYYYVYDGQGNVTNLVDDSGTVVASYAYDTWGHPTSASESIPNASGWTNPFRFSGEYGVLYDAADGLYWMSVRAYDPTVGRFISRDPLGRAPLFFSDQPYAYAGNNPVSNVDPSGQYRAAITHAGIQAEDWKATNQHMAQVARVVNHRGTSASSTSGGSCGGCQIKTAQTASPSPATDGYGCEVGDRACDTQRLALDDGKLWSYIAIALTAIGGAIALLAGIQIWLMPIAALFIPAIAAAAVISAAFNRQGAYAPGWFTDANLNVWIKSDVGTALALLAAAGTALGSVLVLTGAGALFGVGAKVLAVLETGAFAALAYDMLRREEYVLDTGTLIAPY